MVHLLSSQRRDEFLSGDCIARFEMCMTDGIGTPTLYVKSNIIDLYFLSKSDALSLDLLSERDDEFVYIIGVNEGEERPFYLYSSVETLSEKHALLSILSGDEFDVILFNDYAIEIARATGRYHGTIGPTSLLHKFVPKGPDYYAEGLQAITDAVSNYVEEPERGFSPTIKLSQFTSDNRSVVISGLGDVMHVAGFRGATEVHEMLPQIVGDHTLLRFVHSPEVEISAGNRREFSDAMILGENVALSIQAKAFDFDGDVPPASRSNAEKRTRKNVRKAIAQTKGSSRMVREGKTLLSKGEPLQIGDGTAFIFCIFVPSLSLISADMDTDLHDLAKKLEDDGHRLVVLDPMQLLRTLQASQPASVANQCGPDEAFFHLLHLNSRQGMLNGSFTTPIIYRW